MTRCRSGPCPAYDATLTAAGAASSAAKNSASGNREPPSCPATMVVIPWLTAASAVGSHCRPLSVAGWVSMKPGASTSPPPSWTGSPFPGERASSASSAATSAMTPPTTLREPRKPGLPVPSTIVAPRTRKDSASGGAAVSAHPDSSGSHAPRNRAGPRRRLMSASVPVHFRHRPVHLGRHVLRIPHRRQVQLVVRHLARHELLLELADLTA